jgi:uncharacterized membrane protein YhiD involved in acid resistance
LAYIFLAIAIGLALGADQREVAAIALPIILIVITLIDRWRPSLTKTSGNLTLNLEVDKNDTTSDSILKMIESIDADANIRRIDQDQNQYSVTAQIKLDSTNFLTQFSKEFDKEFPNGRFSIIDDSIIANE